MKVPILLPNIFNHPFTYESDLKLNVGDYVMVPFGRSKITGVVWDEFEKKNNRNFKIKNVLKKLDVVPLKMSHNSRHQSRGQGKRQHAKDQLQHQDSRQFQMDP